MFPRTVLESRLVADRDEKLREVSDSCRVEELKSFDAERPVLHQADGYSEPANPFDPRIIDEHFDID